MRKATKATPDKPPRDPKSLADYALDVLVQAGIPMTAATLAEKMVEAGWKPTSMTKPAHLVYTNLHGQIGRHGEASAFRFLGGGLFTTSETVNRQQLTIVAVKSSVQSRPRGSSTDLPVVSNIPESERRCGNCSNMSFHGVNELTLRQGVCERYDESGRLVVYQKSPMCPQWKPLSKHAKQTREMFAQRLKVKVSSINIACSRGIIDNKPTLTAAQKRQKTSSRGR